MKKIIMAVLLLLAVAVVGIRLFGLPESQTNHTVAKPTSQTSQTTTTSKSDLPAGVQLTDWSLVLVNRAQPLSQELGFEQVQVDGKIVDARIAQAVHDFRQGAAEAGYPTTLVSGYRSIQAQQAIYDQSIANYLANGYSQAEAQRLTESVIALPKASEHHTGLAVDIAGNDALARYPELRAEMDTFASQQWLITHAPDYGFVLRYPQAEAQIQETGIDYESWHFRYVGKENARYMTEHNLTLEAYLKRLQTEK